MDAQLRENFLRELMILHNRNHYHRQQEQSQQQQQQQLGKQKGLEEQREIVEQTQQRQQKEQQIQAVDQDYISNPVEVLFLSELTTGSKKISGRCLSADFVACDTNLTHILLNDLKTPIGTQPSALVRLNDVISIEYH